MKKYKGIIFDLDGTLLDTIEDLSDSMNEVLAKHNYPIFNSKEYKLKLGGGFKGLVLNSFPQGIDDEIIDEATKSFVESYNKKYLNKTKPYQGIDHVLDELDKVGIKLGINSNKRADYANDLVMKFFQRIPFIKIYGERSGVPKKPDPTSALEIAEAMSLKPEEVLYIGDSNIDIMTAKNAGMDSVGVLWGFRSHGELTQYGAKYLISTPGELLDII